MRNRPTSRCQRSRFEKQVRCRREAHWSHVEERVHVESSSCNLTASERFARTQNRVVDSLSAGGLITPAAGDLLSRA